MKWPLFLALLIVACSEAPRASPRGTRIVGHGGMGPDNAFPMNTKEAVMACLASGHDGVEVDVQMTKDGALVCYHAQDLSELTDHSGFVNAFDLEELEGNCHYKAGTGEHGILLLDEVLRSLEEDQTVVLDCKLYAAGEWDSYLDDYAAALTSLVMNEGGFNTVNVECQVTAFLDKVKAEESGALIFFYAQDFATGLATATSKGYNGITINDDLITSAEVKQAQDSALQVALFGMDSGDEPSVVSKGADLLQVDEP